jgi:phospholipase/carboxylesterase
MRIAQLGGLTLRLSGGTDGKGGGNGPVVVLLHGFGARGNDLVALADVLDVPTGTRFVFPEGPLTLSFGPRDARAWWLIDMVRMAQDQAAGRARDLSNEIPKGLALAHGAVKTRCVLVQYGEGPRGEPAGQSSS